MDYPNIENLIGNTPLVRLQRLPGNTSNTILAKLEGNNPAGSVKDRAAYSMIKRAEERGDIKPGDTLIEATSGNTGIALAMVAAMRGYKMKLLMPANLSAERRASMKAYGAELTLVSKEEGGMEGARDIAMKMEQDGEGLLLNQFVPSCFVDQMSGSFDLYVHICQFKGDGLVVTDLGAKRFPFLRIF